LKVGGNYGNQLARALVQDPAEFLRAKRSHFRLSLLRLGYMLRGTLLQKLPLHALVEENANDAEVIVLRSGALPEPPNPVSDFLPGDRGDGSGAEILLESPQTRAEIL